MEIEEKVGSWFIVLQRKYLPLELELQWSWRHVDRLDTYLGCRSGQESI